MLVFKQIILFAILSVILCGCNRVNPVVEMERAIEDMRAGRLAEVIVRTDACLKFDSNNIDAKLLNNYCRFMLAPKEGERSNAMYELAKCTKLHPESAAAWYYYGYVLVQSNHSRVALEPLRKALELMPVESPARTSCKLLLAKCCVDNNLQEEARRLLQQLKLVTPLEARPQLFNALGMLALKAGNYRQAMGYFTNGLNFSRKNEVLNQNLAVTADLYLNDVETAMKYYRQCMALRAMRGDTDGVKVVQRRLRQVARRGVKRD